MAAVLIALLLPVLVALAGLVLDGTMVVITQERLQRAADLAAEAGATADWGVAYGRPDINFGQVFNLIDCYVARQLGPKSVIGLKQSQTFYEGAVPEIKVELWGSPPLFFMPALGVKPQSIHLYASAAVQVVLAGKSSGTGFRPVNAECQYTN